MKALTKAQVELLPLQRLPLSHPRAHAGRSRDLPRRPAPAGVRPRVARRRGRHQMALPRLCPLALVQRPDPPSPHPRRDRGRDRPQHPGLDQHLLHQGAALADLRRLAPGRRLFRPGAEGAGLRLGRADRRHPRGRLHGATVVPRRCRASCITPRWVWRTASTAPARPSWSRSTNRTRRRWRCRPARSRCITNSRCIARRPTTPRIGASASA